MNSDTVFGDNCSVANVCVIFLAQWFDDLDGVRKGHVSVLFQDNNTSQFSSIECSGTAYVGSTSVNQGTGISTVSATLDPSSTDCVAQNLSGAIVLNLTGQPNGDGFISQNTVVKQVSPFISAIGNFQSDSRSETFNGMVGGISGPFSGLADATRATQRTK